VACVVLAPVVVEVVKVVLEAVVVLLHPAAPASIPIVNNTVIIALMRFFIISFLLIDCSI
jgi:hypothetical protein